MKGTYTYVYKVYTHNLCWGRVYLGEALNRDDAYSIGCSAGKGVFVIEKKRKYND